MSFPCPSCGRAAWLALAFPFIPSVKMGLPDILPEGSFNTFKQILWMEAKLAKLGRKKFFDTSISGTYRALFALSLRYFAFILPFYF